MPDYHTSFGVLTTTRYLSSPQSPTSRSANNATEAFHESAKFTPQPSTYQTLAPHLLRDASLHHPLPPIRDFSRPGNSFRVLHLPSGLHASDLRLLRRSWFGSELYPRIVHLCLSLLVTRLWGCVTLSALLRIRHEDLRLGSSYATITWSWDPSILVGFPLRSCLAMRCEYS